MSSSSEKRTIKINPELFKVSEKNSSRKKRSASNVNIKVKTNKHPIRDKTFRKGVLRMIRENIQSKQKEQYKELVEQKKSSLPKPTDNHHFESDFGKSIQYFNNLNETSKIPQEKRSHNHTIKRAPIINNDIENSISNILPDTFNDIPLPSPSDTTSVTLYKPPFQFAPHPGYGNLKNGSLPTYRKVMNSTRRNYNTPSPDSTNIPVEPEKQTILSEMKKDLIEKKKKIQKKKPKEVPKLRYLKQRKIYKRTYKLGRSRIKPCIGVLISNKTIRQRISTDVLNLKQTPISEVKRFLIKKGFIKVGSLAPNDVLRQMYETANLMCGEIENHNPENLLYNYFNEKE
jgi:hypothetical protein